MKINIKTKLKYSNVSVGVISIVLIIITFISINASLKIGNVYAKDGQLDLTNINLENNRPVSITGKWEFFYNNIISPDEFVNNRIDVKGSFQQLPASWTTYKLDGIDKLKADGKATYRLTVKLSRGQQNIGLKFGNLWGDAKVYIIENINGKNVIKKDVSNIFSNKVMVMNTFYVENSSFDIIIQIHNKDQLKSGILKTIYIGSAESILTMRENSLLIDMSAIISLFMIFIYFIIIAFERRDFKSSLLLAIASLISLLFIAISGDRVALIIFSNLNMVHLYTYALILGLSFYYVFFRYTKYNYNTGISTRTLNKLGIVMIIYLLLMLCTPILRFVDIGFFQSILGIVLIAYFVYATLKDIRKRNDSAEFDFLSLLSIMLFCFVESYNIICKKPINFLHPIYITIFVLSQALLISNKNFMLNRKVEKLSNRLRILDKRKDEFLQRTSYELKLPLKSMVNIANSLIEGVDGKLNEKQKQDIEMISYVGQKLDVLVHDILDYSDITSGYIDIKEKIVNLKSILIFTINLCSYSIKDRPITIKTDIKAEKMIINGDEDRLKQVMYNLLDYMISVTDRGSIDIELTNTESEVIVSILNRNLYFENIMDTFDDLKWINDEKKSRINSKSTGIGIWVANEIVKLHKGVISCTSDKEEGTKLTIILPLLDGYETVEEGQVENTIGLPYTYLRNDKIDIDKKNILLFEPNSVKATAISNILAVDGYKINKINSLAEFMKVLNDGVKDDICIINSMIPNASGFDLMSNIRGKYSNLELPVLMIVDEAFSETLSLAVHLGANDVILESYIDCMLRVRVNNLLQLKESVEALVNSEMDFLKAQIKPHFIFNVLSVISAMITREPRKAKKLLLDFSEYLRTSFDFSTGESLTHFNKEIDLVKSYVSIQKVRFGDRLHFYLNLEDDINVDIPPLIIQPIVENAIRHGILSKIEGGIVNLDIWKEDNYIVIRVKDDGVGIEPYRLKKLLEGKDDKAGVGVININSRLLKYYGHGLSISSNINQGTEVVIKIPQKLHD